jgi:hypothetical protein
METSLLERKSEQEEKDIGGFVIRRCGQTGEILAVPRSVYEKVENKDKSVANTEFSGFYVSPGFCFYKSQSDFRMFCED